MYYDVIISGGGINGVLSAVGLKDKGLSVALLDKSPSLLSESRKRIFALSKKSQCILNDLNLWQDIEKEAQPIFDIIIKDGRSSSLINYSTKLVNQDAMGYVIDSSLLCDSLLKRLEKIDIFLETTYESFLHLNYGIKLKLSNDITLNAPVLICAEGKNSKLRNLISIPCIKYTYPQKSIVLNVKHFNYHNGIAVEHFFPGGPFAMLPLIGNFKSCIIWTEESKICDALMSLTDEEFLKKLQDKCYPHLQNLSLDTQRKSYNLSLLITESLDSKRVLLIGDSYHTIHPIAGQGLNLGIKDIYETINVLSSAKENGFDLGSSYVLNKYSRKRYSDNLTMSFITHATNQFFSNNSIFLKKIRQLGLDIIDKSPRIKKYFINHAMGLSKLLSISIIISSFIIF